MAWHAAGRGRVAKVGGSKQRSQGNLMDLLQSLEPSVPRGLFYSNQTPRDGRGWNRSSMKRLCTAVAAIALGSAFITGCEDPNFLRASRSNVLDTMTLYALTGSQPSFPTALNIAFQQLLRVDGSGAFDVVFDIDEQGRVVLYPTRMIVSPPTGAQSVGMQVVSETFDALRFAPKEGYLVDSATVVTPGQVVVIEAAHSQDLCQLYISPYVYAKMIVDSVNVNTRAIYVRAIMDPNCGFRGVEEGIPEE
jgi:hypothetical protein